MLSSRDIANRFVSSFQRAIMLEMEAMREQLDPSKSP